jgi:hypothetical protein
VIAMTNISTEAGQSGQPEEQLLVEVLGAASERRARPILLERFIPNADIVESHHIVVDVTPEVTWAALKSVNFAKIGSPLARALLAIRVLLVRSARRRLGLRPLSVPVRLTLDNLEEFGQMKLAERQGVEIVIGALGRPGDVESLFERRTPAEFVAFECPGYVKGGGSFLVEPYGEKRTLLSYEARLRATDTRTRRQLMLWTTLFAPVMKRMSIRTLESVKSAAEKRCAPGRRGFQRAM